MERKLEEIGVHLGEHGHVVLRQEPFQEDVILLHPDQIEVVIKWMREVAKESKKRV